MTIAARATDDEPTDDLHDALSVAEYAASLYLAPNTIRRWIRQRKIASYRVSEHKTVIPRRELVRMRAEIGLLD